MRICPLVGKLSETTKGSMAQLEHLVPKILCDSKPTLKTITTPRCACFFHPEQYKGLTAPQIGLVRFCTLIEFHTLGPI